MKSSQYFLDCVISEKLTISLVLRQQKYVTKKFDKFTFVATDAVNIYADTWLSTAILMTKFTVYSNGCRIRPGFHFSILKELIAYE